MSFTITASEATVEHYRRPEVKDTILRLSTFSEGAQAGYRWFCGDNRDWYQSSKSRLLAREGTNFDYTELTNRYRTLYYSTGFFNPDLFSMDLKQYKRTDLMNRISVLNCVGMSALFDIDAKAKVGGHGSNIHEPEVKKAVELMTRLVIDHLRQYAPNSVYAAYSGGGAYVLLHHEVFADYFEEVRSTDDLIRKVKALYKALNKLIERLNSEFKEKYPEYGELVAIDPINQPKRLVKTLLSVHKKYNYAVVPLDLENPEIDYEEAKLPVSAAVLQRCKDWYKYGEPSPAFLQSLKEDIDTFMTDEKLKRLRYSREYGNPTIAKYRRDIMNFPPCIRNIITRKVGGNGATRALGVLAAFLGVIGWEEEEAKALWYQVANTWGAETSNIFDSWFRQMKCPSCKTLNTPGNGYPELDLVNFDACKPNQRCHTVRKTNPVYYASQELYNKSFSSR
ncbi:hypothetical protein [Methanosarcina soligelidi]|uniref:hypothetical protein n=1 Tax=Methanosarcina soligelidi TaxID=1036677 RepID=UPI00064E8FD4|nr:hypothetical protein [Methanosarcina soligelidi]